MIDFTSSQFSLFIIAALVLAFTPGAGMTYVVARTVSGGKRAGLMSSFGTGVGGFVHIIAAVLGLSALIAESVLVFNILKYVGACYLIFLGVRLLVNQQKVDISKQLQPESKFKLFWEGFTIESLNVKTALFFLAFIPQFIDTTYSTAQQFIMYGLICLMLNTTADLLAVSGSQVFLKKLDSIRPVNVVSGFMLVGLGVFLAAR